MKIIQRIKEIKEAVLLLINIPINALPGFVLATIAIEYLTKNNLLPPFLESAKNG